MGFVNNYVNPGVWMERCGGGLSFTDANPDFDSKYLLKFNKVGIRVGGYGILDLEICPGISEVWAAVGGGSLHRYAGGMTWKRDNQVDKLGSNIYKIKSFEKDTAFARGANGLLLKYDARNADGA